MKVLGLGLPRTGTASFTKALKTLLDFRVYHGGTQLAYLAQASNPLAAEGHTERWIDILSIALAHLRDSRDLDHQRSFATEIPPRVTI